MPTDRVGFSGPESPSLDELSGGTPPKINLLTDDAGALRPRPGIAAWDDFPVETPEAYPVVAIGAWRGVLVYVTQNPETNVRRVWTVPAPGVSASLSPLVGTPSTQLLAQVPGLGRPVVLSTRDRVWIAGGGKNLSTSSIWIWEGAAASRSGPGGIGCSHVTAIAQRIVANDPGPSGIIYWSNIGSTGETTWPTGLNFREAETKQDPVVALYENSNELVAVGTETIQMLSPDPSEVFTPSRTIPVGSFSPYSYVPFDEIFALVDHRKRVVMSNGRSLDVISSPFIGGEIEAIDVTDCWGMRYTFGVYDLGLFNFDRAGRSFCYDAGRRSWSEWRSWDDRHGAPGAFAITSHFPWKERGIHLVGLASGRIGVLDPSVTSDLGQPIVSQATSTFENHGSSRLKKCDRARIRLRRGQQAVGGTAVVSLEYRDDLGAFCEPFRIDLGDPNDVAPVVEIPSLGTYRQRQWRITVDSALFRFSGMEVDFQLLDH